MRDDATTRDDTRRDDTRRDETKRNETKGLEPIEARAVMPSERAAMRTAAPAGESRQLLWAIEELSTLHEPLTSEQRLCVGEYGCEKLVALTTSLLGEISPDMASEPPERLRGYFTLVNLRQRVQERVEKIERALKKSHATETARLKWYDADVYDLLCELRDAAAWVELDRIGDRSSEEVDEATWATLSAGFRAYWREVARACDIRTAMALQTGGKESATRKLKQTREELMKPAFYDKIHKVLDKEGRWKPDQLKIISFTLDVSGDIRFESLRTILEAIDLYLKDLGEYPTSFAQVQDAMARGEYAPSRRPLVSVRAEGAGPSRANNREKMSSKQTVKENTMPIESQSPKPRDWVDVGQRVAGVKRKAEEDAMPHDAPTPSKPNVQTIKTEDTIISPTRRIFGSVVSAVSRLTSWRSRRSVDAVKAPEPDEPELGQSEPARGTNANPYSIYELVQRSIEQAENVEGGSEQDGSEEEDEEIIPTQLAPPLDDDENDESNAAEEENEQEEEEEEEEEEKSTSSDGEHELMSTQEMPEIEPTQCDEIDALRQLASVAHETLNNAKNTDEVEDTDTNDDIEDVEVPIAQYRVPDIESLVLLPVRQDAADREVRQQIRIENPNFAKVRRRAVRWTAAETIALQTGVKQFGVGKWALILEHHARIFNINARSQVDLKDKWRNLSRTR